MHPILFRIPLPHGPLKLWWGLVAVAAFAAIYALLAQRRKERDGVALGALFVVGAGIAAYVFRATVFEASNLPIYSYGVMLGLSLVVGWYLTLSLAEREVSPRRRWPTATCHRHRGARRLAPPLRGDEPRRVQDVRRHLRPARGGLVAYGGFIGGYLGSWAYLARSRSA